jgi:hypothetical protein
MRASIPGITVLAISAASNLLNEKAKLKKKAFLSGLLMVGAMTPIAEIARAVLYPAWPINLSTTLVGANCGGFPPHYVALLNHQWATHLLRPVHDVPLGIPDSKSCGDTAFARREN